ncbi:DUF1842 domain-containing protein [Chromobacterium haemolyticum]|uniref:DUF1842 domain-containing protein n=1 Tax=Chromobacterium TaxID=535 RepID=UPI0040569E99
MSATGLFHTRYIVSAPVLGAPVLTLDLLVNTLQKKVSGHASIFQSVSPPLQFQANVWGHYSQAKLDPSAEHHIVLSLDGSPSSPNSQIAETFHLQGILDQNWKDGHASYRFFYQNAWHTVAHAIVTEAPAVHPEPRSGSKPYPHPIPLYAAALQQSRSSDNLAQMKSLAIQAEEQLKQHDNIEAALKQLHAEIARLEGRH